jgi:hypothetical protein
MAFLLSLQLVSMARHLQTHELQKFHPHSPLPSQPLQYLFTSEQVDPRL